jgi:voltage-gated potassium channel
MAAPEHQGAGVGVTMRARIERLDAFLELPLALLGLVWLGLIVAEFGWGASGWVEWLSYGIWGIFLVEFGVRFSVTPHKLEFLRSHWLEGLSLVLPCLRVFSALRVLRALTAVRSVQLARVIATFHKAKIATGDLVRRSGHRNVLALTLLVTFCGAAGMFALEGGPRSDGFETYGDALWWTAMLITTIASQYWPNTPEGRILALLLSCYSLGVLGYITAALSSFLIGKKAVTKAEETADTRAIESLREEVARLAAQVQHLAQHSRFSSEPTDRTSDDGTD